MTNLPVVLLHVSSYSRTSLCTELSILTAVGKSNIVGRNIQWYMSLLFTYHWPKQSTWPNLTMAKPAIDRTALQIPWQGVGTYTSLTNKQGANPEEYNLPVLSSEV